MADQPVVSPGAAVDPAGSPSGLETVIDSRFISTLMPGVIGRTRLLVPVDVQAFVVPAAGGEPVVRVTGGAGDPPPFAATAPVPAGVHLHWALPDALLTATPARPGAAVELPRLPDRWVVVRVVTPVGGRRVQVRRWVIDAAA